MLQGAVDNGNTWTSYGSQARSDLGVANGTNNAGINGYVASLSAGFTLKGVQKAFGGCWFGAEHVDLICSDQNSFDQFFNKLQPQQRYYAENSDVGKIGFSAFSYTGAQVVVDQYCPAGEMYGLNTKSDNLLFFTSAVPRYQFGMTGFKEAFESGSPIGVDAAMAA